MHACGSGGANNTAIRSDRPFLDERRGQFWHGVVICAALFAGHQAALTAWICSALAFPHLRALLATPPTTAPSAPPPPTNHQPRVQHRRTSMHLGRCQSSCILRPGCSMCASASLRPGKRCTSACPLRRSSQSTSLQRSRQVDPLHSPAAAPRTSARRYCS